MPPAPLGRDSAVEAIINNSIAKELPAQFSFLTLRALDHFIVLGERHLNHIVGEWVRYYHELRPHQAIGNVPPTVDGEAPAVVESLPLDDIVCHQRLGGLLKHYERRAA